ncbi:hypothetical protein [Rhodoferax ferrireducens]|uniref:hypothetical protein n=1 Tax=Rhodoferax ferrireducens TaxID=192843 RepID=UPI00140FA312|nr:hypothetical protein [Rhodoferax ferrireducens]WPC65118.1 hypothetical protein SBP18_11400 [Rhodoferax ferrireducens]
MAELSQLALLMGATRRYCMIAMILPVCAARYKWQRASLHCPRGLAHVSLDGGGDFADLFRA